MIKATFKNIGPIKAAELELGNLTIIAGQNNTGKTYLAYTLYGFLNFLKGNEFRILEFMKGEGSLKEVENIVDQITRTGRAVLDCEEYEKLMICTLRQISALFSSSVISEIFSSPNDEFKNANFQIEVAKNVEKTKENTIRFHEMGKVVTIKSFLKDDQLIIELDSSDNDEVLNMHIRNMVILLLQNTAWVDSPESFILSAERFGISLFYKELDFTKNRLVEELQKLSDKERFDPLRFLARQSARYAQPIKDNIDFTRDLSRIQRKKSGLQADKLRSVDRMMDGYYRVKNDEIRFISKRRGNNRFDIPLHLASSSARGVSDLYFYLKHVAQPEQILIIDEPESHLSPTNQILMARLLVFCVNSGLKVLITTHSDYLIKEINNLILLNCDFSGKKTFLERNKEDYTENDHLDPKSVKAYICEGGKLKPCPVDMAGIAMPVFDDAIDNINKISTELFWRTNLDDSQDD